MANREIPHGNLNCARWVLPVHCRISLLEVLFLATIATGNCGLDKLDSPVCDSLSLSFSPLLSFISPLFPLSFAAISKKHAATTNCALTINPLSTQLIGKLRNGRKKQRTRRRRGRPRVFIETFLRVLTNEIG